MESENAVNRDAVTSEVVAKTFRLMRLRQRLTQKELTLRVKIFGEKRFGTLLESQVSDFERGRTMPSFGSLLNFLAGLSSCGSTIDFSLLQEALSDVLSSDADVTELAMTDDSGYKDDRDLLRND